MNGLCRGREHLKELIKRNTTSRLYTNNNKKPCLEYTMNITGTYNKALTRQITEAVKIDTTPKPLINTKIGFNTKHHTTDNLTTSI